LKKIDGLITNVLENYRPDIHEKRRRVLMLWKDIAGSELADLARIAGYEGSVLILRTYHPAASMEIQLRKIELLKKINSIWDQELFTDMKTVTRKNGR
jgi:hypothetical protein